MRVPSVCHVMCLDRFVSPDHRQIPNRILRRTSTGHEPTLLPHRYTMATATQLQKVSQRVKNASLKLTEDTATHCPFLRRVNMIIEEFKVENALKFKFREQKENGGAFAESIESVLSHAKFADAVLAMSPADLKSACADAKATPQQVEICKAILTNSIPAPFDFLWREDDPPIKIYASLRKELIPSDETTADYMWDDLDNLDLFKDFGGNVTKLAAKINELHKRLQEAGETVSVAKKVKALLGALRPMTKFKDIILELGKTKWRSFTRAKDAAARLLKAKARIDKKIEREASESSSKPPPIKVKKRKDRK